MAQKSRITVLLSLLIVVSLSCIPTKAADKTDNVKTLTQAQFVELVFD